jgi:tetratricopeptide (TPR) repeat protein
MVIMQARRRLIALGLALVSSVGVAVHPIAGADLKDLYFGEALFRAYQGQFFDAIQRLDTEIAQYRDLDQPELDTLHYHIDNAEFSVGDFELNYRMHQRAGRAIKSVLDGAVDEAIRNEAAFRLARIHFQKDQLDEAQNALGRMQGTVPAEIKDDVELLRSNMDIATGHPRDAVNVLQQLNSDLSGFVAYNLGIALFRDGRTQEAIEQLDKAGKLQPTDYAGLAIRDKSNLVLGSMLFEAGDFERAKLALKRIRLDGLFSNQALLRAGWTDASSGQYERALVAWNILVEREPTDGAVQEAMLAVPHAYAGMNLFGNAAVMYERAVDQFSKQIVRVDASIASIREGRFLKALIREESRQDETWVIRLRNLPDAPETYYLMEMMASHDFQNAMHNYLDLEDLQSRLTAWQTSLDAFDDLIKLRNANYEPLLPEVDARFRALDQRIRTRLEQRKHLSERLKSMLNAPRPDYLATAEERITDERMGLIEKQIGSLGDSPESFALRQRVERLRGALAYRIDSEYPKRLAEAQAHLKELNTSIEALTNQYDSFIRARQAATHTYVGYEAPITQLRERVEKGLQRVEDLMARQGQMIETVAINELEARRQRLVAQQSEARFGAADSYDRASRAQPESEAR